MIALPAVAATMVLVHLVLAGTRLDLGETSAASAPAVLALAMGWGLLSRAKLPDTADTLAIALLTPLRGPICDAVLSVWPQGAGAVHAAAVLSLGPLGWMLGRSISSLVHDGVLVPLAGLLLGELAVVAGAVAWLPGVFGGPLLAVIVAVCVEVGRHRRRHSKGANGEGLSWEALPLGFALGTLVAQLVRVAPAYADPGPHVASEVVLALGVPALLVAIPASNLLGKPLARKVGLVVGALALAWAMWRVDHALSVYRQGAGVRQSLTWAIRARAWEHPGLEVWWFWLVHFATWAGVAAGLALAPLRRAVVGPLVIGVGVAWLAQHALVFEPLRAPQVVFVVAAALAGLSALAAVLPRRGWIALALAAAAPWGIPRDRAADFDWIWRVGEPEIVGFERTLATDVRLVSTFGPTVSQRDSRLRYADTFNHVVPFVRHDELDDPEVVDPALDHPFVLAPESRAAHGEDGHDEHGHEDDAPLVRHYGVRIGGTTLHGGHEPHGPAGSVGRLTRLFAPAGRAFVAGLLAEVVAADLVDAGLTDELTVTSPAPLGRTPTLVLLDAMGLSGFPALVDPDPLGVLRTAEPGAYASVVVAPGRVETGLEDMLGSVQALTRARALLAPGGRCLAWIDTSGLDGRSLAARLAAFGAVFGSRSAAFVEPRELDPPFVLLVGWTDDSGRPDAREVTERCRWSDGLAGRRVMVRGSHELSSLLLADGARLEQLAGDGPVHSRARPVRPSVLAPDGWAAVRELLVDGQRPSLVLEGASDDAHVGIPPAVVDGLVARGAMSDHLDLIESGSMFEVVPDIDWQAFDAQVDHYARAAAEHPDHPLLHLVVAARLESLARTGHYQRFAEVFNAVNAEAMPSWRIKALHAFVLDQFLEHDAAREARAAARDLIGGPG